MMQLANEDAMASGIAVRAALRRMDLPIIEALTTLPKVPELYHVPRGA
jgi:hypothetical protein